MIAELFKESRFQRGLQQGLQRGIGQGIQIGASTQQKAWEGWNSRREQAQADGREFTEPPPTLESDRNGQ